MRVGLVLAVLVGLLATLLGAGWAALPQIVARVLEMQHLHKYVAS